MKRFRVVLSEKHKEPRTHTIPAIDSAEAYEWGDRHAQSLGIDARVEVFQEIEESGKE